MSINYGSSKKIIITGVEDKPKHRHRFEFITDFLAQMVHLWQYRDLVRNLVIRDLKVRYKNSALGILWSMMNPLLMMIVFTVVFTVMAPIRAGSMQGFPAFILCGLLPWNFFASSVIGSTTSIVGNGALLKKVYFPREILPLALVLAILVNFLIALVVLFAVILLFGIPITIWLIYLPLIIFIQIIFILGVGFILSTVNVFYRDTQQVMDVVMLAWFFVTPIFWPIDILPRNYELFGFTLDVWRVVRIVNPMASLISNYRDVLFEGVPPGLDFLARTALTACIIFLIGWVIFQRYSWRFAEEL
jgi:ABC-type polysaccharide/polyol phosphate export permease